MALSSLRFFSFRNLVDAEIDTDAKDVFLIGKNGQGKTNFLESVYFCSYASSFRSVNDRELMKTGAKSCSVQAAFDLDLYKKVLVKIENGKKNVVIDGKKIDDRKELISVSPCVVFCYEDMAFAAGAPENRRWFFDQSQSLGDQVYLDDLRNYRKILKTRNVVLKEYGTAGNAETLDALDAQLAAYGLRIMKKRADATRLFSETFSPLYERVSGIGGIEARYAPSWKETDEEGIAAFLKARREGDFAFGSTFAGPHRDRYIFAYKGAEFARNASTGQKRLLALLMRAAEAERFSIMTGKKPILLLDDVLLELDPEKRARFLEVLPEYDQAFYTFLPEEPYQRYRSSGAIVYEMESGGLSRIESS
jgi:DNA replication and repair protein RecF